MAEGGASISVKDGSDADFDVTCTPCGEDNVREEAVKYCSECEEFLCSNCTKHHGRLKATRTHKLLKKDDAKKCSAIGKTKCLHHPDRDIEMYCGTHDMVYCVMCIATDHRSCGDVSKLGDMTQLSFNQTEVDRILDETKNVTERMKGVAIKQKKNIISLEEQRNNILEKIEEAETRLINQIKKIKQETFGSLERILAEEKGELETAIGESTEMLQLLEKTSDQLLSVGSMDEIQAFVKVKLMKQAVADANGLHEKSELNGTSEIHFRENSDLITSVMTSHDLGKVFTDAKVRKVPKPNEYKMKSKREINVKLAEDKETCLISDVCQLPDDTIILTDQNNIKVKRLDTNYNIKDHCDLDGLPLGICCVNDKEVAVKMAGNAIQFITVSATLSKTRCISTECGSYYGIAYCAGKIWASTGSGVNVYTVSGQLDRSIEKIQNSQTVFKSITQHMAVIDETVIVADWSDGAVYLSTDGTIMKELRDKRLNNARGVCVSRDGTVFLCGYSSHNIVMFSSDRKFVGELVAADVGIKNLISLCYDNIKHCIIATCHNSNNIYVVDFCQ